MAGPLLVVSWTIPPWTTGSAVIVGNLAKQFSRDEMVVVGELPNGCPPVQWHSRYPHLYHCAAELPHGWHGARWARRAQLPTALIRILSIARRHRCSAVMAVFPKEEYLLLGYLAAQILRLPFFPYFHNTFVENRTGLARRSAQRLQDAVFSRAQHVFVMSQGMVQLYEQRYRGLECSALVHSFNEVLPEPSLPPVPGPVLKIAVLGTINEACRDATQHLSVVMGDRGDVAITYITGTPTLDMNELGLLRNSARLLTVSRDHIIAELQNHDLVFLPLGFTGDLAKEEYDTIFPTRTIEYLICGRPILAYLPGGTYLHRFLQDHECALIVDSPDPSALLAALDRIRMDSALRGRLVEGALRAARQFRAPVVAKQLRQKINQTRRN